MPPYFFSFVVSGQPASVNDGQGIKLQPSQNEAFEGHQIVEQGFTWGRLYRHPLGLE